MANKAKEALAVPGHVRLAPAASMPWTTDTLCAVTQHAPLGVVGHTSLHWGRHVPTTLSSGLWMPEITHRWPRTANELASCARACAAPHGGSPCPPASVGGQYYAWHDSVCQEYRDHIPRCMLLLHTGRQCHILRGRAAPAAADTPATGVVKVLGQIVGLMGHCNLNSVTKEWPGPCTVLQGHTPPNWILEHRR